MGRMWGCAVRVSDSGPGSDPVSLKETDPSEYRYAGGDFEVTLNQAMA